MIGPAEGAGPSAGASAPMMMGGGYEPHAYSHSYLQLGSSSARKAARKPPQSAAGLRLNAAARSAGDAGAPADA